MSTGQSHTIANGATVWLRQLLGVLLALAGALTREQALAGPGFTSSFAAQAALHRLQGCLGLHTKALREAESKSAMLALRTIYRPILRGNEGTWSPR